MEERKRLILDIIIKDYIATGCPVASSQIVDKYKLPFSSATVRNEMAELEELGLIVQPHTSAGRIPTERAYNLYLEGLSPTEMDKKEKQLLAEAGTDEEGCKQTAKVLAKLSGLAVVWALHRRYVYYTGLANLFQQPEFSRHDLVYDISETIDHLEEIVSDVFDEIDFSPLVKVGQASPFGPFSGTVIFRYKQKKDHAGLVALIGPMRMDYEKNLGRLNFLHQLLNN